MSERRFHGIFCDDVRLELGGKYSLIGCYGTDLGVPGFPFFLPKMSFSFSLTCPRERKPENVRIVIKKDGEKFFNIDLDLDHGEEYQGEESLLTLNGGFDMVGVKFEQYCVLEAEAHVDGEVLHGPGLIVHEIEQSATKH